VVIFRSDRTLEPGTLYTIELLAPDAESNFGFQAFDGAVLEPHSVYRKFNFFTRRSLEPSPRIPLEPIPSCERVAELFRDAGCTASNCHGGESPRMGLRLDSVEALVTSAIARVAHQTEIGPSVGVPLRNPSRFEIGRA